MNGKVQTVITWGFAACFASILYPTIGMIDNMDASLVWFLQHCPWQKVDPRCVHLLSSTARTGRNLCQIRSRWSWIAQLQLTKTLPCFYSTKKKLRTIPGMESCVSCEVVRMRRTMCMTPMVTYRSFKFHWKWLDFCRYGWYGHGFMA